MIATTAVLFAGTLPKTEPLTLISDRSLTESEVVWSDPFGDAPK